MSERDNKVADGELHMYCHVSQGGLMGKEQRGVPAAASAGVEGGDGAPPPPPLITDGRK